MTLEEAITDRRMRDTFAGYDWGTPVRPWTVPRPVEFDATQLAIADEWFERRWAA